LNRRTLFATVTLAIIARPNTFAADGKWSTVLHADDFLAGPELQRLNTRHHWKWKFEDGFEVAVRKSAIPVSAPKCRMDYLILTIPVLYPEPGKPEASPAERQAVYDALVAIRRQGKGGIRIRFDAMSYWQRGPSGPELTSCNIWFTLPLEKDAAKILQ